MSQIFFFQSPLPVASEYIFVCSARDGEMEEGGRGFDIEVTRDLENDVSESVLEKPFVCGYVKPKWTFDFGQRLLETWCAYMF